MFKRGGGSKLFWTLLKNKWGIPKRLAIFTKIYIKLCWVSWLHLLKFTILSFLSSLLSWCFSCLSCLSRWQTFLVHLCPDIQTFVQSICLYRKVLKLRKMICHTDIFDRFHNLNQEMQVLVEGSVTSSSTGTISDLLSNKLARIVS